MKLHSLSASNFKSFGNEAIEFYISDDLNIIAGRNGSGKSNLMAIYLVIREVLEEKGIDLSYYHDGNTNEELRIGMQALLDDEDIRELMASLNLSADFKNDFVNLFGTDLKIDIITIPALQQVKIRIGKMWIYDANFGSWYEKKMNADSTVETALSTLVENSIKEKISLVQRITRFFEENRGVSDESPNRLIRLGNNIHIAIKRIFDRSVVFFPEFRQRSEKTGHVTQTYRSPKGENLPSVLYNLKNGNKIQRRRFNDIQKHFSLLFPGMNLEVKEGPEIVLEKTSSFDITQDLISAGLYEIISIITHLIAVQNTTFIIDEPESHLHPHAERQVAKLIEKASETNQVICITHSANFIKLEKIDKITMAREIGGQTQLFRFQPTADDLDVKNKLLRPMTSEEKEFLFANSVLLVEGDTEYGAMPILSKKSGYDFDDYGVSVITVGGSDFVPYIKILENYHVPWLVMCDRDVIMGIGRGGVYFEGKKIRSSPLILKLDKLSKLDEADKKRLRTLELEIQTVTGAQKRAYNPKLEKELRRIAKKDNRFKVLTSDFEGVLKTIDHDKKLFRQAEKEFGSSKVLQGRYIAERIDKVPDELKQLIKQVCFYEKPVNI